MTHLLFNNDLLTFDLSMTSLWPLSHTGSLIQVLHDKSKSGRGRLGSFSSSFKESKKDMVRQVFLFTNHMLLTTRASNGRLHLAKVSGKCRLCGSWLVGHSVANQISLCINFALLTNQCEAIYCPYRLKTKGALFVSGFVRLFVRIKSTFSCKPPGQFSSNLAQVSKVIMT